MPLPHNVLCCTLNCRSRNRVQRRLGIRHLSLKSTTANRDEEVKSTAQFDGKTPSAVAKAGETLQWLVKFAEAHQTVTYGQLSKLIGNVNHRTVVPRILGTIGHSLEKLSAEIPPIELLVVNQRTKIPGRSGLLGFLIKDKQLLERLSLEDKRLQWEVAKEKIFDWNWRNTLEQFGLSPISITTLPIHQIEAEVEKMCSHGGGEQDDHRRLKEYIASNPAVIGLKQLVAGKTEHTILSGDRLDVFFTLPGQWVCVEVKGKNSPDLDLLRGMFQCIKYRAVLEAQRHYSEGSGALPTVRVVLALATDLPDDLKRLNQFLGVEIKANITVPSHFVVFANR
jgi:hypothetical protein